MTTYEKPSRKDCHGRLWQRVHSSIGKSLSRETSVRLVIGRTTNSTRGLSNGFLGFDLAAHQAKIYGSGDEAWTGTTVETIGLAVARLLRKSEQVKNRFIYIYSVRTTQNQILKTLESVTSSTWSVRNVKWADEIPAGRKLLQEGNRAGVVPLILSYFFRPGMGADYVNDIEPDNIVLGLPTRSIEDIVREAMLEM